jgi:endonuclease III
MLLSQALMKIAKAIPPEFYFPAKNPEAAKLIVTNPYAFLIASCLDRGTKAEVIWTIPYEIKNRLGHLDPLRIYSMTLEYLRELFGALEHRPRYINDAPKTVRDMTQKAIEEFGGDASKIWEGKRVNEVKKTLLSIHGVGIGIANMTVLLIEKAFSYRFADLDRKNMDIKPDIHTKRVLYRLGVIEYEMDESAIEAARTLNPSFPGELDGPLWWIGRNWCNASNPDCKNCPLSERCEMCEEG